VAACIALVNRILSKTEPTVCGEDLVEALQTELPIPTSASDIPSSGLLGVCVNLVTIVCHAEEDPIEYVLAALTEGGVDFTCFPGAYDRESAR
jgi:hypothetical protein